MKTLAGLFRGWTVTAALTAFTVPVASASLAPNELYQLLRNLAEYDAQQVACTGERDARLVDGLAAHVERLDASMLGRSGRWRFLTGEQMSLPNEIAGHYEGRFAIAVERIEARKQNYAASRRGEDPCSEQSRQTAFNSAGSLALLIDHPVFVAHTAAGSDDEEGAEVSRSQANEQADVSAIPADLVQNPSFEDLLLLELASSPDFYENQARAAAYGIESGLYGAASEACRDLTNQLRTGVRQPVAEELLAIADRGEIRLVELLSLVRAEAPPPVQVIIVGDADFGDYDFASGSVPVSASLTRKSVLGPRDRQRHYPITVSRGPQRLPNEVPALTGDSRYLKENGQLIENGPCQAIVTSFLQTLVTLDPRTSTEYDWDQRIPLAQPHVLSIQVAALDRIDMLPMSPERFRALREAGLRSVRTASIVRVDVRPDANAMPGVLPGTVLRIDVYDPKTDELLHQASSFSD